MIRKRGKNALFFIGARCLVRLFASLTLHSRCGFEPCAAYGKTLKCRLVRAFSFISKYDYVNVSLVCRRAERAFVSDLTQAAPVRISSIEALGSKPPCLWVEY